MNRVVLLFIYINTFLFSFAQLSEQARGIELGINLSEEIGETRALIIGVSDYYSESLTLKYADNDAILFYLFLLNNKQLNVQPENIRLLLNKEATVDNIVTELDRLKSLASPNDKTIIYFAGHADVVKVVDNEAGFFLTHFASDQREYRAGGAIPFSHVELITDSIATLGSKVWLITDACRSGTIINETGAKLSLTALNSNFNKSLKIVSSKPEQLSYEFDDIQHGIFTYYLVQALMGKADDSPNDQEITADEIRDFLRKNVKMYTSKMQTPSLYTNDDDEVLAFSDSTSVAFIVEGVSMMKAVYTEKVAGLFEIDLAFEQGDLSEDESKVLLNFSEQFDEQNLFGNDSSAYKEYLQCLDKGCKPILCNILKNNLINALNSESQKTINDYIDESVDYKKENILSNEMAAMALDISLKLIDTSNFNFHTIYARKLFFDAYVVIKNKEYKKYKWAENQLLKSLEILPNAAYTLNALGELYDYWHHYKNAEHYFKMTVEAIPTWAKPYNALGNVLFSQGNYKAALKEYEKALETDSTYDAVYNNIGNVFLDLGQYRKAEEFYQLSLTTDSNDVIPIMNLGVLSTLRGSPTLAEKYYIKATKADTSYAKSLVKLGNYYLSEAKDYSMGLSYLEKAIELSPKDPYCLTGLGDYYHYYDNNLTNRELVTSYYNKALEMDPYYVNAYIHEGWYLYNTDKKNEAEAWFQLAIDSMPYRAFVYHQMGRYKEINEQSNEAISFYQQAIEIDSFHYESYVSYSKFMEHAGNDLIQAEKILKDAYLLFEFSPLATKDFADFYYRNGDTTKAVKLYEEAKAIDPSFAYAYASLALIYLHNADFNKAITNYKKAVLLNPGNNELMAFLGNVEAQATNLMDKNLEAALKGFNAVLEIDPLNLNALNNAAKSHYLLGRPDFALPLIEKCLEVPDLGYSREMSYLNLKGLILLDSKKYEEALDIFNSIIDQKPMPTYLEKCVALTLLKEKEEALDYFKKEKAIPYSRVNQNNLAKEYSPNFIKQIEKLNKLY